MAKYKFSGVDKELARVEALLGIHIRDFTVRSDDEEPVKLSIQSVADKKFVEMSVKAYDELSAIVQEHGHKFSPADMTAIGAAYTIARQNIQGIDSFGIKDAAGIFFQIPKYGAYTEIEGVKGWYWRGYFLSNGVVYKSDGEKIDFSRTVMYTRMTRPLKERFIVQYRTSTKGAVYRKVFNTLTAATDYAQYRKYVTKQPTKLTNNQGQELMIPRVSDKAILETQFRKLYAKDEAAVIIKKRNARRANEIAKRRGTSSSAGDIELSGTHSKKSAKNTKSDTGFRGTDWIIRDVWKATVPNPNKKFKKKSEPVPEGTTIRSTTQIYKNTAQKRKGTGQRQVSMFGGSTKVTRRRAPSENPSSTTHTRTKPDEILEGQISMFRSSGALRTPKNKQKDSKKKITFKYSKKPQTTPTGDEKEKPARNKKKSSLMTFAKAFLRGFKKK